MVLGSSPVAVTSTLKLYLKINEKLARYGIIYKWYQIAQSITYEKSQISKKTSKVVKGDNLEVFWKILALQISGTL